MPRTNHRRTVQRLSIALFMPTPIAATLLYVAYLASGGLSTFELAEDANGMLLTLFIGYLLMGIPSFVCGLILEFLVIRRGLSTPFTLLISAGLGLACSLLLWRSEPIANLQIAVIGVITASAVGWWLLCNHRHHNQVGAGGHTHD